MTAFTSFLGRLWTDMVRPSASAYAVPTSQRELYDLLKSYYHSNGLYDSLMGFDQSKGNMKPLRNPAHRAVEFYVSHLWPGTLPGALPIITENPQIVEPIEQVWQWSNWSAQKQIAARWLALYGDLYIKIATDNPAQPGRVYLQLIDPHYVTDIDEDYRGVVTECRIDIPIELENDRQGTHTEYWDAEDQTLTIWEHDGSALTPIEHIAVPGVMYGFGDFGIDFIPIVHAKFQDVGECHGVGCFTHALDKIDEANRQATRLSQMLYRYNKATWALLANGTDPQGRPLPPPRVGSGTDDKLELTDDSLVKLPGTSQLQSLVPQINYEAALSILQDMMRELMRDLPELAYYELQEKGGDLSGRAIRLLLSGAIDRVVEARGNAEAALIRANQIALTIGQYIGLFSGLGDYDNGDFDHSFAERDVIRPTVMDKADTLTALVAAQVPTMAAMKLAGFSEEEIAEAQAEKSQSLGQALLEAERAFNQGSPDTNVMPMQNRGATGIVEGQDQQMSPEMMDNSSNG